MKIEAKVVRKNEIDKFKQNIRSRTGRSKV